MRRALAAGNWKMNGSLRQLDELDQIAQQHAHSGIDILVCPPAPLIAPAITRLNGSALQIGAQDCHAEPAGAHTGDVSAAILADVGATHVITGHSERRQNHHETDDIVCAKTRAVWRAGLTAILCIGESAAQRKADNTLDIIAAQLSGSVPDGSTPSNLVIAYEPIWAIGTGLVPTLDQIEEVHAFIRARVKHRFGADIANGMRLLYGGSVNATNAAKIFTLPDVDGALVGGASLKAADFSPVISALENSAA
ncbi:triose-phosphate isomerase [Sulfitobacter sp. JL08]|uniref:triose-phosphate isomerase n=1 Tax=unclassified Sulfitobacter TaxID=196795 RepID=UPI000E0C056E|nr:triose-phosphate isomerase [Sulfitobacter sp. JL08]AXI55273.1 triose-phosphate isomerase [Sulfitobacter sp. JL08]